MTTDCDLTLFEYARSVGASDAPLTSNDLLDLSEAARRVLVLLERGQWVTREMIERVAGRDGRPAAEGMSRMRELRQRGWEVEKRRPHGGRIWMYRLKKETR